MRYSKQGLLLTEQFEGCRLVAYKDRCPRRFSDGHVCTMACDGVWTIGYGHTHGVFAGMTITQDQAERFLMEDIASAENTVNTLVKISLHQHEFDALVDFVYNVGGSAFAKSTMLKLLTVNNVAGAAEEFEKWKFDNGKVVAGLLKRRLAEEAEFKD